MLGIGLGGRDDDYEVSGVSTASRGAWQDRAVVQIRRVFAGEDGHEARIGPRPQGTGPSLIVGGSVRASFQRAARHGDGWILGGGGVEQFNAALDQLRAAWTERGRARQPRTGQPRTMALAYFSHGDDAERTASGYLRDYYAFLGEHLSGMIARSAAKDTDTVRAYVSAFEIPVPIPMSDGRREPPATSWSELSESPSVD